MTDGDFICLQFYTIMAIVTELVVWAECIIAVILSVNSFNPPNMFLVASPIFLSFVTDDTEIPSIR